MINYLKRDKLYFKLINKIQKNGKKYKIFLNSLNLFFYMIYFLKYLNLYFNKLHFIKNLNLELELNLFVFIKKKYKKKYKNKFLRIDERLKEFLKLFYILLFKQKFRKFIFRFLFLISEVFFFFDMNLFSVIKKKIFSTFSIKSKKKKINYNYLGYIELLNMFNIIITFIIILLFVYIIKRFLIIKKLFLKFFKYFIYLKNICKTYILNIFFNYNIQKKKINFISLPINLKNLFIFFQFGSKKHSYFKIWFNNIKRKKYWIWKWRN